MCRIGLSSNQEPPESKNEKDYVVNNSFPVNALNNPFKEGDTVVVPAGFEAVLLIPGVPKYLALEEQVTAEVTNVTQPQMSRFDKEVFMPTIAFRMQDGKQYEGDLTVDIIKANNLDTEIVMFS